MAVSPLVRTKESQKLFKKLGFDVVVTKEGKFSEIFEGKKVGIATMSKKKLISLYGEQNEKNRR